MAIGDLRLMDTLKTKMQWHQARQRLLAENVANSDTPRYKARDLRQPVLAEAPNPSGVQATRVPAVQLAVTEAGHVAGRGGDKGFKSDSSSKFEVTANGNAVDLEDQMAKSAENQLDYQTAASLYQQSLALIRTALGRK
ncbi:flagellar basal body rod protein FlgB [Siculibacillus lacustris]|uniref:Flagellar basal body rod protein FlgB n=1 Tax=Siculibacillus lacustris TaxID=1549641 RepID=A0A4Q9VSX7_9HYPH|nr:flagellar basal body rod protein FlgB [Siculibacillus lacustris]TBW38181.1 flagellar basal body rod protein FlgB [Siculibacillus lacustris]